MNKKTIAVDIDDVIADSTDSLRLSVNKRAGVNLTPEHYKMPHESYWGYYERVWETHGVDISLDDLDGEMEVDQSHVPLLAGASFALSELTNRYNLIIITSRPHTWELKTTDWLKAKLGNIFISVHFTDKGAEKKTKGKLCKGLGVDWLIDDNPEHCQSAIDDGIGAVLFGNYGWHHKAANHLIRCKDWPAVLDYFQHESSR